MSSRIIWRMTLLVLLCMLGASVVDALPVLDATYTSPDGSFTFSYPDQGLATIDDSHIGSVQIRVPLYGQMFNINVYRPWMTQVQFDGVESLEAARELLTERMGASEETIEINTLQSYRMLEFFDMANSFWVLVELGDGAYGMVSVHDEWHRRSRLQSLARTIALSYSYTYPVVQNYDGSWEEIIAEMQQRHIIAEQGSLVLSQPDLPEDWGNTWLSPVDEAHGNVVISARITVTGSAQCGILAHVQPAVVDNAADLFALRLTLKSDSATATVGFSDSYGVISRGFDFKHISITDGSTHNYLLVTNSNTISIYVDGNPLIENVPIAPVEGYYGLYFIPVSDGSHCAVSDYWVYEHDVSASADACMASVIADADGYISPIADRVVRGFSRGEIVPVVCHHSLEDGQTWYLLQDGLWIESDRVRLSGNCANLMSIY